MCINPSPETLYIRQCILQYTQIQRKFLPVKSKRIIRQQNELKILSMTIPILQIWECKVVEIWFLAILAKKLSHHRFVFKVFDFTSVYNIPVVTKNAWFAYSKPAKFPDNTWQTWIYVKLAGQMTGQSEYQYFTETLRT